MYPFNWLSENIFLHILENTGVGEKILAGKKIFFLQRIGETQLFISIWSVRTILLLFGASRKWYGELAGFFIGIIKNFKFLILKIESPMYTYVFTHL